MENISSPTELHMICLKRKNQTNSLQSIRTDYQKAARQTDTRETMREKKILKAKGKSERGRATADAKPLLLSPSLCQHCCGITVATTTDCHHCYGVTYCCYHCCNNTAAVSAAVATSAASLLHAVLTAAAVTTAA